MSYPKHIEAETKDHHAAAAICNCIFLNEILPILIKIWLLCSQGSN